MNLNVGGIMEFAHVRFAAVKHCAMALLLHKYMFFWIRIFWHKVTFTQNLLHTNSRTQRGFLHRNTSIQGHFLHTDTFPNGCLVAQVILHRDACTHKCSWARTLWGSGWKHIDFGGSNQSGIRVPPSLICRFTHKNAWGEMFLDRSTCSQRWFRKRNF